MEFFEQRVERSTIFNGKVFSVHLDQVRLQNGEVVPRELVEHHGGVAVLAVDEQEQVLMVRQYRYGIGKELWELPAGKIDPNEEPKATGLRELEEETGYLASEVASLGEMYPTGAYDSEIIYLYTAKGLTKTKQKLDHGEFLEVEKMPLEKVIKMCVDGTISDAKTVVAVLRYAAAQGAL